MGDRFALLATNTVRIYSPTGAILDVFGERRIEDFDWSPDGKKMVYSMLVGTNVTFTNSERTRVNIPISMAALKVIDLESRAVSTVFEPSFSITRPSAKWVVVTTVDLSPLGFRWSPTGNQLAFNHFILRHVWAIESRPEPEPTVPPEEYSLSLLDMPGGGVRHLMTSPLQTSVGGSPVWSPDGTEIAFLIAGDIHLINASGSNLRLIAPAAVIPGGGEELLLDWVDALEPKIIVNSTADRGRRPDATCCETGEFLPNGEPECTLRAAIEAVNAGCASTIEFDVPDESIPVITPATPLPAITMPVVIDAVSPPAGNGGSLTAAGSGLLVGVKLNGLLAGLTDGLQLRTSNCVIRGLSIQQFQGAGILIEGGHSHTIKGNFIGTDSTGAAGVGNGVGIQIRNSVSNILGGFTERDRNVVSANRTDGIALSNCVNMQLIANLIGTTPDGNRSLPNGVSGLVAKKVRQLLVGIPGLPTIINSKVAAHLGDVTGGRMANCLVGVNAGGNAALGGTIDGVRLENSSGFNLGRLVRNVFGGIPSNAICVLNSTNIELAANYIGTDRTGNASLPVGLGILAERVRDIVIGATNSASVITATNGVILRQVTATQFAASRVINTHFGLNAAGNAKLGDMDHGIIAERSENVRIGGAARNFLGGIKRAAFKLSKSTNILMAANFIGTDRTGNTSVPVGTGIVAEDSQAITVGFPNLLSVICATNGAIFRRVSSLGTNASSVINTHFGLGANGLSQVGHMLDGFMAEQSEGLSIGGANRNVFGGIVSKAIALFESTNIHLAANYIGTDRTGNTNVPVGTGIVAEDSQDISIGSSNSLSVISATNGAILRRVAGHIKSAVFNTHFGVAANGSNRVGNMRNGLLAERSSGLLLGGTKHNVFGHIASNAITFQAMTNVQVLANLIGTDATGLTRAPIGGNGITAVSTADLTVGDETGFGKFRGLLLQIGACAKHAVEAIDSPSLRIVNSSLGTDSSGTRSLSNTLSGVKLHFSPGFFERAFERATTIAGNTIAFNGGSGVEITQDTGLIGNLAQEAIHVIQRNSVRNNARDGIRIGTNVASVLIGGTNLAGANEIIRNGGSGISKRGIGQRFFVEINSILSNSVKAIERSLDPQNQGAPQITSAVKGSTHVQGNVSGQPNQTVRLHFYAHRPKPGPQGEGEMWVGTVNVPLNAAGVGSYNAVLPRTSPAGWLIASTAADPVHGTSEFSNSQMVQLPTDTDGDGLPDQWEALYPSCLNPLVPDPPDEDCDGDGFTNLQEYIAHTDPTRADSALRVENLVANGDGATLKFTGVAGRQYGLERRADLAVGSWVRVATAIPEADGEVTLSDPDPPEENAYYRIVAEFP